MIDNALRKLKGLFQEGWGWRVYSSETIGNRLGRCRHLVTVSRRVAADEHMNTNTIHIRDVFVSFKRP
jgi:hypothetical protein